MYAKGKHAYGFCDRTGFRYPLKDLVYEYKDGKRTGLRVGRDMVDEDHPQNNLGETRVNDFQSLYDPRPDRTVESLWGWNPVGNPAQSLLFSVGRITVVTT